jgi:GNAT superfamily N-acetyltransferase
MVSVRKVPRTATATEPAAALLRGYVDVSNQLARHTWGADDYVRTPQEVLASTNVDDALIVRLAVVEDGTPDEPEPEAVLGTAVVYMPLRDNTSWAYLGVAVRPEHRGRGLGTLLHDEATRIAQQHERTTFMAESEHGAEPPAGPGAITAPTGAGRIPADDPGVRFLASRDWSLEQTSRRSLLPLPVDPEVVERFRSESAAAAGPDYRTVGWDGHVPDEWRDAMARLLAVMSDGSPMAGLEYEQELWDTARVRRRDEEHERRGITTWTTAAQHLPSGDLVGYTVIMAIPPSTTFLHQEDTLVVPEHRGHRLGMLLKAENLRRVAVARPGAERIGTWNAEENDHMLAINIALGFRPSGCAGVFQRKLA